MTTTVALDRASEFNVSPVSGKVCVSYDGFNVNDMGTVAMTRYLTVEQASALRDALTETIENF